MRMPKSKTEPWLTHSDWVFYSGNPTRLSGNLVKNATTNGFTLEGEDMPVHFNTAIANGEAGIQIQTGSDFEG